MNSFRDSINQIDAAIIEAIAQRCEISKQMGLYKHKHNIKIHNKAREGELYQIYTKLADKYNVDSNLIVEIFNIIIEHSKVIQNQIKNET